MRGAAVADSDAARMGLWPIFWEVHPRRRGESNDAFHERWYQPYLWAVPRPKVGERNLCSLSPHPCADNYPTTPNVQYIYYLDVGDLEGRTGRRRPVRPRDAMTLCIA